MPWIQYISFFVYRPTEVLLYCWHTGTHGEMAMLSGMGGCYIQGRCTREWSPISVLTGLDVE